jgi:sugar (pentulose or hexulose) kinase
MKYFMGIDVSTTSSKVLIINSDGSVIGVQSSLYALSNPQP